jgi:organic hydroperoxide reductase OsmC/OhrA
VRGAASRIPKLDTSDRKFAGNPAGMPAEPQAISRERIRCHLTGCACISRAEREGKAHMQAFPHHYTVAANGLGTGDIELKGDGLPTLRSASPIAFGGPGDRWSPETLLVASIGDCLILTFRAVARASGFAWTTLECDVTGTLDRPDRTTRFVAFDIRARLCVPAGTDPNCARQLRKKG